MVRTCSSFETIFQCKCKTVKTETGKEIINKNILELECFFNYCLAGERIPCKNIIGDEYIFSKICPHIYSGSVFLINFD